MLTPTPSFTFATIDAPGALNTVVDGISDCDEVVGAYYDSSGGHGFIDDDGTYTTLNVPGITNTYGVAINDRGEVAGFYDDSSGEQGCIEGAGSAKLARRIRETVVSTRAVGSRANRLGG
jgi:hypothetical protein